MKKFAMILLAMLLVVVMAATAMAEAAGIGSITIDNAVEDQTYTVYQILDLESYDINRKAYSYKATAEWSEFVNSAAIKGVYLNVDEQGYVTWVNGANAEDFALAARAWAKIKNVDPSADPVKATSTTVEFTGLDLGYYLVDTTLGTLCSLDTTTPNVTMKEKNEVPTVEKKVEEDSTGEYGDYNDADINQVVNYMATITVQKGAENYILHDKMSAGLTYVGVTKVTVGGEEVAAGETTYTVVTAPTDGCTFEVVFNNKYIDGLEVGTEIIVYYSAVLNEDAVVGAAGNKNEAWLQYGDENMPSYTPKEETITYTLETSIIKYTEVTDDNNVTTEVYLSGAKFKLSSDDAGEKVYKFHNLGNNVYEVCADAACEDEQHVTEIETDATGTFKIEGLDAGVYYLTETQAPAGYNKLAEPITITVTGVTNEGGTTSYSPVTTKVENNAGTELPSTGGMGTTILYAAGGILLVGALVLMLTKKRASTK